MFGQLGNIASMLRNAPELMRQAHEMQARMREMQEGLAKLRVEGSAGGGMVTVEANGQQKVLAVRIEPALVESGDREMLEDLLLSAVNQALDKARETAAEEMGKMAGQVDLSSLGSLLNKPAPQPPDPERPSGTSEETTT